MEVIHADEADIVFKFAVHGKAADDLDQFIKEDCRRLVQQAFHIQHEPLLGVKFFVLPLHFVEAIGEEHQKIAGQHRGFGGLVGRVFKEAEGGLAAAAGVGERFDLVFRTANEQGTRMAGVGKPQRAGAAVGQHIRQW